MNKKITLKEKIKSVKKKNLTNLLLVGLMLIFNDANSQSTNVLEAGPLFLSPGVGEKILFNSGELNGDLTSVTINATFTSGSNNSVYANDLSLFVLDGPNTILQVGGYTQLVVGGERKTWSTGNTATVPTTFSDTQVLDTPITFSSTDKHKVAIAIGNYTSGSSGTWESISITLNGVSKSLTTVDNIKNLKFSIYPNPSNDVLNIENTNFENIDSIKIMDLNGRLIKHIDSIGHITQLNISDFSNGIYTVVLKADGKETIEKFIKK